MSYVCTASLVRVGLRRRATRLRGLGQPHRSRAGVRALGAEDGLHHRLHRLHPVPRDRHRRQLVADVDGNDDAAADPRVAALQAPALRDGRRLGPGGQVAPDLLLPLATRPVRAREPDPPEEPVNDTNVIEIATQTLMIAAKISAPILLVTLALGLGVSLVQSVTQVQEHTITFVPKLAGVAVVILFSGRSEEHTSELQSLMRNSYAVFCLKKKKITKTLSNRHQ